jgi:hypothetical protein
MYTPFMDLQVIESFSPCNNIDFTHAFLTIILAGFSETCTYDDVVNADCTSCAVTTDKSVYWTPALYFKHDNGSYELVPQTGGMLA